MPRTVTVYEMVPIHVAWASGGSLRPFVLASLQLTIQNETGKHIDELCECFGNLSELLEDVSAKNYADDPKWRNVFAALSDDMGEFNNHTNDTAMDAILWAYSFNNLLVYLTGEMSLCNSFELVIYGEPTDLQLATFEGVDSKMFAMTFYPDGRVAANVKFITDDKGRIYGVRLEM